jgi:hypothetical protein
VRPRNRSPKVIVRPRSSLGFRSVSEVEALFMRELQYVLMYKETKRWPFLGLAGIAYI